MKGATTAALALCVSLAIASSAIAASPANNAFSVSLVRTGQTVAFEATVVPPGHTKDIRMSDTLPASTAKVQPGVVVTLHRVAGTPGVLRVHATKTALRGKAATVSKFDSQVPIAAGGEKVAIALGGGEQLLVQSL